MFKTLSGLVRQLCGPVTLLVLLGWASIAPAATAPSRPLDRWEMLRAHDQRVLGIAYRLSLANTALCPNAQAPQAGFVLHSLDQYEPADRQEAARKFALGAHIGVMSVVAGSPAGAQALRRMIN